VNGEFRCYVCCPTWLPQDVGDLNQGLESVWNGDVIKKIRKSMLDSSFRYCDKNLCPEIQADTLHDKRYMYKKEYREYLSHEDGVVPHGPRIVYFSEDKTCNLACPSCRKDYISLEDDVIEQMKLARSKFLPELMRDVEELNICSSGDPFTSRIYRDYLFELDGSKFPKLQINLNTNGVLLTKEVFQKMKGIHANLGRITVSLDAATEPTYNIVRVGGNWKRLKENLKSLAAFREQGLFKHLQIDFVVQDHNFREMPEFVKLGLELGVDKVYFQRISNWGTFDKVTFEKRDVLSPSHPLHGHFKDVCRHPLMRHSIIKKGNIAAFTPKNNKEHFYAFLKNFRLLRLIRRKVLELTAPHSSS
jgi:MoaA/NifB/PqqE/SkfB family radical SAM enzyme